VVEINYKRMHTIIIQQMLFLGVCGLVAATGIDLLPLDLKCPANTNSTPCKGWQECRCECFSIALDRNIEPGIAGVEWYPNAPPNRGVHHTYSECVCYYGGLKIVACAVENPHNESLSNQNSIVVWTMVSIVVFIVLFSIVLFIRLLVRPRVKDDQESTVSMNTPPDLRTTSLEQSTPFLNGVHPKSIDLVPSVTKTLSSQ
jgi:hypothetical protein